MLPHPISLQVLPQLAGVPQLNLLCHPCPSHKFSLSPAQLTKTQSERWSHFSWRNSAYRVSSIGVSSCYSFLNQKWNRGRKKLSFDVLVLQSDKPMLLRPSHFCFFQCASINTQDIMNSQLSSNSLEVYWFRTVPECPLRHPFPDYLFLPCFYLRHLLINSFTE